MRLSEIEKKARGIGIKDTWKFTRKELIRRIQHTEGNIPCFASTAKSNCIQFACLWRPECIR